MGLQSRVLFLLAKTNMSSVRADELSALQASPQPPPARGSDGNAASHPKPAPRSCSPQTAPS